MRGIVLLSGLAATCVALPGSTHVVHERRADHHVRARWTQKELADADAQTSVLFVCLRRVVASLGSANAMRC